MAVATKTRRVLSDEDVATLLGLLKDSDSVELKLTVPEPQHRSTVDSLGMDPLNAQIRQVYFFDTPDLALDRHGVVVRARRIQGKGDDSVIKLRPLVPAEIPAKVRKSASFGVEVDVLPGQFVCSGTMRSTRAMINVRDTVAGDQPLRKLFSKEQRQFFEAHAPEGIEWDNLSTLGPIFVLKLKLRPEAFGRGLVAEMWLYPDGSRILELSTKCTPAVAFQVAAETRAFLTTSGVDLSGDQQTKTRKALLFFAKSR